MRRIRLLCLKDRILANPSTIGRDSSNTLPSLWQSPLGQRILHYQRAPLTQALVKLHGEKVLWIGDEPTLPALLNQRLIKLPMHLNPAARESGVREEDGIARITAGLDQLPFRNGEMDGVVIHHALEQCADPRVALREVCRVLAPGGRLIVVGLNPWSLLGFRRIYAGALSIAGYAPRINRWEFLRDPLAYRRIINPVRLFDWFTLLGLEQDAAPNYVGLGLWRNRFEAQMLAPAAGPSPFGGIMITSAVKQAANLRMRWAAPRRRQRIGGVVYPRVAQWNRQPLPPTE